LNENFVCIRSFKLVVSFENDYVFFKGSDPAASICQSKLPSFCYFY